jgi:hypothetical protein
MSRMRDIESLPMADPGRERDARELFPFAMSPEEYAARHAHEWYCFSFDDYRYADPVMERWIHRLGDILFRREGAPSVAELRERYLTAAERAAVAAREKEEL